MKFCAIIAILLLALVSCSFAETAAERCGHVPEGGMCMAYFKKFAYDSSSGECKEFIWGGCGGNPNGFDTQKECEDAYKQ